MANEVEDAEKYITGVTELLEGCSDAKRIEILTEKVQFWYMAARLWGNACKEANKD